MKMRKLVAVLLAVLMLFSVVPFSAMAADSEPAVSVPTVVTDPVEGVAYKLGLNQTTKGAIYYFKGEMSGFYGATDTAIDNAVDMYLEDGRECRVEVEHRDWQHYVNGIDEYECFDGILYAG
jgi:hypothetical protein